MSSGHTSDLNNLRLTYYIDPFNILKLPYEPYTVAYQVIEAFPRTWPHSLEEAPRFTSIAQSALLVLIETGLLLVEMPRLLTDKHFREGLLEHITNHDVVDFFHRRFDKWGRETPLYIDSVANKEEPAERERNDVLRLRERPAPSCDIEQLCQRAASQQDLYAALRSDNPPPNVLAFLDTLSVLPRPSSHQQIRSPADVAVLFATAHVLGRVVLTFLCAVRQYVHCYRVE